MIYPLVLDQTHFTSSSIGFVYVLCLPPPSLLLTTWYIAWIFARLVWIIIDGCFRFPVRGQVELACLLRLITGTQIKVVNSICIRLDRGGRVRGVGIKQCV